MRNATTTVFKRLEPSPPREKMDYGTGVDADQIP
jgi:hypothetical protein